MNRDELVNRINALYYKGKEHLFMNDCLLALDINNNPKASYAYYLAYEHKHSEDLLASFTF